jgi:alcohol oxidase
MPCVMSTRLSARLQEWESSGTGKIAHKSATMFIPLLWLLNILISGIEAMVKMRPTAAQLTSTWPVLQLRWEAFFQHSPDKPMAIIVPFAG